MSKRPQSPQAKSSKFWIWMLSAQTAAACVFAILTALYFLISKPNEFTRIYDWQKALIFSAILFAFLMVPFLLTGLALNVYEKQRHEDLGYIDRYVPQNFRERFAAVLSGGILLILLLIISFLCIAGLFELIL